MTEQELLQYCERNTAHLSPPFEPRVDTSGVFARARCAILNGLVRLDKLPRTNPFWRTWANHRATMTKLQDYSSQLLQENPADEEIIWLAAALSLNYSGNDFASEAWRALHKLGRFNLAWAIDAAAYVELGSGVFTVGALVDLLRELGLVDQARAYLQIAAQDESSTRQGWALRVLAALSR
jgi:hypothetical protein